MSPTDYGRIGIFIKVRSYAAIQRRAIELASLNGPQKDRNAILMTYQSLEGTLVRLG